MKCRVQREARLFVPKMLRLTVATAWGQKSVRKLANHSSALNFITVIRESAHKIQSRSIWQVFRKLITPSVHQEQSQPSSPPSGWTEKNGRRGLGHTCAYTCRVALFTVTRRRGRSRGQQRMNGRTRCSPSTRGNRTEP